MTLTDSLNVVVFSKDRPAQLDLFLSSINIYWPTLSITVLYKHSHEEYQRGYDLVRSYHSGVTFVKEDPGTIFRRSQFKQTLMSLLDPTNVYTVYFVDDIIFMATPDEQEIAQALGNEDILCTSLRMAPYYDWCYTCNTTISVPEFDSRRTWAWAGSGPAWGYPMSVDGHIYRTADILPMINACKFRNPNQFEHQLNQCSIKRNRMHCLEYACLVNNPANRVQDEFKNSHSGQSVFKINNQFLAGKRLDPECVHTVKHRGPHTEFPLRFLSTSKPKPEST